MAYQHGEIMKIMMGVQVEQKETGRVDAADALHDDESVGRRSFAVIVYDDETYDWVSYEVPADSDRARNTEALDPITINDVEFVGYRSINTGSDGTEYHYALYMGVVNGHYIEILCTDGSADGVLFEDQMNMARSIHIK